MVSFLHDYFFEIVITLLYLLGIKKCPIKRVHELSVTRIEAGKETNRNFLYLGYNLSVLLF